MDLAEQSSSKGGPGPEASASSGNLIKMQNPRPSLRLMNQKVWGGAHNLFQQALQVTVMHAEI